MKKVSNAPRVVSRGKPPKPTGAQKTTFQKELDKWPSVTKKKK